MSKYELAGLLAPISSGPTFLIPYFGRPNTNLAYAQELKDGIIDSFMPFSTEGYLEISGITPSIHRSTGDEGVFSFRGTAGDIFVGSFGHIKQHLLRELILPGANYFFRSDARHLLGDAPEYADMIRKSALEFKSAIAQKGWLACAPFSPMSRFDTADSAMVTLRVTSPVGREIHTNGHRGKSFFVTPCTINVFSGPCLIETLDPSGRVDFRAEVLAKPGDKVMEVALTAVEQR